MHHCLPFASAVLSSRRRLLRFASSPLLPHSFLLPNVVAGSPFPGPHLVTFLVPSSASLSSRLQINTNGSREPSCIVPRINEQNKAMDIV
ncbi:hypothetical protein PIB30_023956 [Stylosanthes scabra]|uniref:Uncharacterized protein n=1 Tax=Stylosanthes scabra TaxID=79078 RepID=A0ABU6X739_9FABA|nr:hypothetical protein [Stylosanthes scabra]